MNKNSVSNPVQASLKGFIKRKNDGIASLNTSTNYDMNASIKSDDYPVDDYADFMFNKIQIPEITPRSRGNSIDQGKKKWDNLWSFRNANLDHSADFDVDKALRSSKSIFKNVDLDHKPSIRPVKGELADIDEFITKLKAKGHRRKLKFRQLLSLLEVESSVNSQSDELFSMALNERSTSASYQYDRDDDINDFESYLAGYD